MFFGGYERYWKMFVELLIGFLIESYTNNHSKKNPPQNSSSSQPRPRSLLRLGGNPQVMSLAMRDSKRGITSEGPEEISDVLLRSALVGSEAVTWLFVFLWDYCNSLWFRYVYMVFLNLKKTKK